MEISNSFVYVRKPQVRPATVVVTGSSRGGTSAISYVLTKAGLNMGHTLHRNYEDAEIMQFMNSQTCDTQEFLGLIERRNSDHDRWGFKLPSATFHLKWLDAHLRSPAFVFVYRSPLSVAKSVLRRDPPLGDDADRLARSIEHSLRYFKTMTASIRTLAAPIILVDYETAHFHAETFVPEFLEALEIEGEGEEIAQQLALPGYKEPSA